jgi:acetyltransferase-like isoleucine patch superfamily enzyme
MRWLIERLIQRVRNNAAYTLHPGLSTTDIITELLWRGRCLLRAQWKLLGVAGGRLRFVEPGCSFRHRRHLSIGPGSVLEFGTRFHCLGRTGIRLGRNVTVGKYSLLECTSVLWHEGDGMVVGDNSSIGDFSFMGCAGGIRIGANVLMGQRVSFHSQNHNFANTELPIIEQGVTDGMIVVEDGCWLGSGAIVLAGVHLGAGSVVAAGSVVTKSFGPGSILAGVPADIVRLRGGQQQANDSTSRMAARDSRIDLLDLDNQEGMWRRDD